MPVFVIYLMIWIPIGLLGGTIASLVGSAPAYGVAVDLTAAVATMIGGGLLDHAILPLLGYTGTLFLIAIVAEPFVASALVMWMLRVIKRRSERSNP